MEFDITQMNWTLKKVLKGIEFEQAIKILLNWQLCKHSHKALMINDVEPDMLEPK